MLVKTGIFKGNGAREFVECGFTPKVIIIKSNSTENAGLWTPDLWCERSNVLGLGSSYISGIKATDNGFVVGSSAIMNTSGVTSYYTVIGDEVGKNDFEVQSWAGNGLNGHEIQLTKNKLPIGALIKRDSPREAAFKVGSNPTVFMAGTAATDCIAFGQNKLTLTSAVQVNEWDSAGGLGEGIDGIVFYGSDNQVIVSWTGNGVAGRVIPLGLAASSILVGTSAVGSSSRYLTKDMAGSAAPIINTALIANEGSLSGNNLVIGSSVAGLNADGVTYSAIVMSDRSTVENKKSLNFKVKNKQAVYLPAQGIASYITCGNSDATLKIDDEISYEFFGAVFVDVTSIPIVDNVVIARGSGPYGNIGGYSWSLLAGCPNDGALGWANAQIAPQFSTVMGLAAPLANVNWRTGILFKYGQMQHIVATHASDGNNYLYVNGVLVKQAKHTGAALLSVAGQETVIGARKSSSSYVRNTRLIMQQLSIYNRPLTSSEVIERYEISAFNASKSNDVVTGLAARWNADNSSGIIIPDQVNSGNDGTVNAGVLITL